MEDILSKIIDHKLKEVEQRKKVVSQEQVRYIAEHCEHRTISMRRLLEESSVGIIAEFKRRSPSKGWINESAQVSEVVSGYANFGAAAISVLTDAEFFGGSLEDLTIARAVVDSSAREGEIALLRKEFIIDLYQIYEARAAGADAVLLIAACLTVSECAQFAATAHRLQMEVLLEIHSESELCYLNEHIDMLGVNNRNLGTFHTDVKNSFRLAEAIGGHSVAGRRPLLVSESGIHDPALIIDLRLSGFRGFLIGETFMKTENPSFALSEFLKAIESC